MMIKLTPWLINYNNIYLNILDHVFLISVFINYFASILLL